MEKETLELKHIAGYLPWGLKGEIEYKLLNKNHVVLLSGALQNDFQFESPYGNFDYCDYEEFKPILFPLSSLTKERLEEFSICFRMWYNKPNFDYELMIYSDIELCYKYHLDIFGLIEKSLAIDASTLTENPYK